MRGILPVAPGAAQRTLAPEATARPYSFACVLRMRHP